MPITISYISTENIHHVLSEHSPLTPFLEHPNTPSRNSASRHNFFLRKEQIANEPLPPRRRSNFPAAEAPSPRTHEQCLETTD